MGVIDIRQAIERRRMRLNLLREFNVAGKDGAHGWRDFIMLAKETGFKDADFSYRLGANTVLMRLWQNGYAIPDEWRRKDFKKIIVGTLYDRYGFPLPEFRP